jgi:hypothetical protein
MDKVYLIWNQDNSKPLLVPAPRKAGKLELLCAIAAEHLQLGTRVCVITTSRHMVRSLTCKIAAKCLRNGLATTIDGYEDDHAMITYNDSWILCIVGKAHDGIDTIAKADTILEDDAPYVDPVWFLDCLLPCIQTTPSVVFGTPTSDATTLL